jgi:Spy/CpxP family protein refolding chaperone
MKTLVTGSCLLATLLAVGSGASVSGAPAAGADGGVRPLRAFMSGQFGRLLTLRSELGVTGEQRAEIRQIVASHRSEIVAVAKPIVEKRRALRDAVLAENPDETSIRAAANDLGKAIGDAAVLASQVKPEVYQVLTPEQQKKVEVFRTESHSAMDRFMHEMATVE